MKRIPLTQGKYAIVDDEDYPFLSRFSWQANRCNGVDSVATNFKLQNGRWVAIPMNRFLYKPKIQYRVIFANKNALDNRKENIKLIPSAVFNGTACKMYIRFAVKGKMRRNPTSIYKGVSFVKDKRYKNKKWKSTIQFQGKQEVKMFATEKEGAIWYNEKAKELFGEFAYQNKII
jgi:hypothetical protein